MTAKAAAPARSGWGLWRSRARRVVAGTLGVLTLAASPAALASGLPTPELTSAPVLTTVGGGVSAQASRVAGSGGALTAAVGTTGTAQKSAQSEAEAVVSLEVTNLAPQVLTSGQDLTITGTLTNGTDSPVSGSLLVQMQRSTEMTTSALGSWLEGKRTRPLTTVATVGVDAEVAPGASVPITITVPASRMPLRTQSQWGPRGVQVSLMNGKSVVASDRTIVIWDASAGVDPTRTTVIIPAAASAAELQALAMGLPGASAVAAQEVAQETSSASASPSPSSPSTASAQASDSEASAGTSPATQSVSPSASPSPSAEASSRAQARSDVMQRLATLLRGAGNGVVIAVDPALLATLGVLDTATSFGTQATDSGTQATATPTASAFPNPAPTNGDAHGSSRATASAMTDERGELKAALARAAASGSLLVLPWTDADISALVAAGHPELVSAAYERSQAAWKNTGLTATSATAWATGNLDEATLAALPTSVTSVIASAWDMPVRADLTYTPSGSASVEGRTVLVPDPVLTGIAAGTVPDLDNATASPEHATAHVSDLDALQLLRAATAIMTRQAPSMGRNALVVIDRALAASDPQAALARAQALTGESWSAPQSLTDLLGRAASPQGKGDEAVSRAALPANATQTGGVSGAEIASAQAVASSAASFASILPKPDALVGDPQEVVYATASTAWRAAGTNRAAFLALAGQDARNLTADVSVASSSTINVIASSAELPVRVSSSLPQAATVHVRLRPSSTRLQAKGTVSVTVPAHGEATVKVPIRAVGSGDVDVAIDLLAADGSVVGTSATLHTRVRADWENLGTTLVAGLLALLFIAGMVRTVRRGRRTPEPGSEEDACRHGEPGAPPSTESNTESSTEPGSGSEVAGAAAGNTAKEEAGNSGEPTESDSAGSASPHSPASPSSTTDTH